MVATFGLTLFLLGIAIWLTILTFKSRKHKHENERLKVQEQEHIFQIQYMGNRMNDLTNELKTLISVLHGKTETERQAEEAEEAEKRRGIDSRREPTDPTT